MVGVMVDMFRPESEPESESLRFVNSAALVCGTVYYYAFHEIIRRLDHLVFDHRHSAQGSGRSSKHRLDHSAQLTLAGVWSRP